MAMNAAARSLVGLITEANSRLVIPVYQRPYSWDEEQCVQLWDDIISVGKRPADRHFTGSVVWVQDGVMSASGVTPLLLIDGQQRITTLTLLIAALADYSRANPDKVFHFSHAEIMGRGYLLDSFKPKEDRYKLTLSQGDKDTLCSLLDNLADPDVKIVEGSSRIIQNFHLFRNKIEAMEDPNIVWDGIQRLDVVSISLDAGKDNPQLIFESMNSTGKDLSSADLIRNFVLMGLPREEQEKLYLNHWRVIEETLGEDSYDEVFDEFIRNYLTVLYAPEPLTRRDIYSVFKRHVVENGYNKDGRIVDLLKEIEAFAGYYAKIRFGAEVEPKLKAVLDNLAKLNVSVVNPLLLSLYQDYDDGAFEMDDFIAMVRLVESFVFRRAVCDAPTNSLNKFLPSVIAKLNKVQESGGNYREAFESYLFVEDGTARRFPTDAEFVQALETRDIYHFRRAFYLLSGLENWHHPKDPLPIDSGKYTIEHIMPQNALNVDEWRAELGPDCEEVYESLLHNLGNLTLTAYNSELSDCSFAEKKDHLVGGYSNEYLVISKAVHDADSWNGESIGARAKELAAIAKERWPFLTVSSETANKYRVKADAAPKQKVFKVFKDLLNAGYIKAGDKLVPASATYADYVATVTESGTIRLPNGEEFGSPSAAAVRAVALAGGSGARGGWGFWRHGADGLVIDEVRSKYLKEVGSDKAANTNLFRMTFWSDFFEHCADQQGFTDVFGDVTKRAVRNDSYVPFSIGTSEYYLDAKMSVLSKRIGVDIWFCTRDLYDVLLRHRDEIAAELSDVDGEIVWDDPEKDAKSRAFLVQKQVDFENDDRSDMFAWLVKYLWKLRDLAERYTK